MKSKLCLIFSIVVLICVSGCGKKNQRMDVINNSPGPVNEEVSGSAIEHDIASEEANGTNGTSSNVTSEVNGELEHGDNQMEPNTSNQNIAPSGTVDESLDSEVEQRAIDILETMSLEEKVAQMFFARCPEKDASEFVTQYPIGGYLLFGRDFKGKTKEEVIQNISSYQKASKISLFIGVDEEGGTVTRISRYDEFREEAFASPRELYNLGGFATIISDTVEKSNLLTSLGINVNFAPVCDISVNEDDFMYDRSFGQNAELTSEYVTNVVSTMKEQHMLSVLKHFPGYGNNVDTHTGIAIDERPYETFETVDFLPFEAGIKEESAFVLVSHNIVSCMDEQYPASLSPKVHEILRGTLNFNGIIITDDLSMDAIGQYTGDSNAAVLAVLAGNDMLCSSDVEVQIHAVLEAIKDGIITEERIDESVERILVMKLMSSIIE